MSNREMAMNASPLRSSSSIAVELHTSSSVKIVRNYSSSGHGSVEVERVYFSLMNSIIHIATSSDYHLPHILQHLHGINIFSV